WTVPERQPEALAAQLLGLAARQAEREAAAAAGLEAVRRRYSKRALAGAFAARLTELPRGERPGRETLQRV
ncbi:hypothetical protein IDH44_18160, partial [Paenibacillus sp. IB182496]